MRKCWLCGSVKDEGEIPGLYCGHCDKRVDDAHADLVAELS